LGVRAEQLGRDGRVEHAVRPEDDHETEREHSEDRTEADSEAAPRRLLEGEDVDAVRTVRAAEVGGGADARRRREGAEVGPRPGHLGAVGLFDDPRRDPAAGRGGHARALLGGRVLGRHRPSIAERGRGAEAFRSWLTGAQGASGGSNSPPTALSESTSLGTRERSSAYAARSSGSVGTGSGSALSGGA